MSPKGHLLDHKHIWPSAFLNNRVHGHFWLQSAKTANTLRLLRSVRKQSFGDALRSARFLRWTRSWLDWQPNYAIECDLHGVMRAVPDLPAPLLGTQAPEQIRDADLIVLQPGEKYELKSLADPRFSLNFRRHGVYTLSLHFSLASEHYALPKNSPCAKAPKNSSH